MKAILTIIQSIVLCMSLMFFAGCYSGTMTSYTSGPDGKYVRTKYSFVYMEETIVAESKMGIMLVVDQQEKKYIPGARELGALPPSDLYSKANVGMHLVNLTSEILEVEILSYKKPNGELLTKVSKLTIAPEGAHRVNFGEITVATYGLKLKGIELEYKCRGTKYASSFAPKRLTYSEWDEYYYKPDRVKAKTAAELFRK